MQPPSKLIDSDSKKVDPISAVQESCSDVNQLYQTFHTARGRTTSVKHEAHFASLPEVKPRLTQDATHSVAETFKERLQAYKKMISKDMSFTDQLDMREPQLVTEYALSIFTNMRLEEDGYQLQPDYLSRI